MIYPAKTGDFYYLKDHFDPEVLSGIFALNNIAYAAKTMDARNLESAVGNFHSVLTENGYLSLSIESGFAVLQKKNGGFEKSKINLSMTDENVIGMLNFLEICGISIDKND